MSRDWVDQLAQTVKEAAKECEMEIKRLGIQGQTETAGSLFQGNAFFPYGAGQDVTRFRERGRDM